jgi:hypothetical protein
MPCKRPFFRSSLPALLLVAMAQLCPTAAARTEPEESVFVYGVFAGDSTCPMIEQRLASLPLRETAIVSVEESGGRFVLDDRTGPDQLRCAIGALARGNRRVKLLLLQDTRYVGNDVEAVRRMRAVAAFARKNHGIDAAVVDIEPYADRTWTEGSQIDRRAVAFQFTRVLKQLKKVARPLHLEAALPWWLTSTEDVPEIGLKPLFGSLDGVYLMLYGMSGDPQHSMTDRVMARLPVDDPMLRRGRVYLTLTTEDEPSREQLDRDIAELRQQYGKAKGFAGVAVFHAGGSFATSKPAQIGEE